MTISKTRQPKGLDSAGRPPVIRAKVVLAINSLATNGAPATAASIRKTANGPSRAGVHTALLHLQEHAGLGSNRLVGAPHVKAYSVTDQTKWRTEMAHLLRIVETLEKH